jgi:DNA invertase Pin-like site-specific DNA recombinase
MESAEQSLITVNTAEAFKQKAKAGRKPWMPPDLEQVEALASSGLTYAQIADALGIHLHTPSRSLCRSA